MIDDDDITLECLFNLQDVNNGDFNFNIRNNSRAMMKDILEEKLEI